MPGVIIDGREEEIEGLIIVNYKDEPKYKLKPGEDMRNRRTRWVRSVTGHTTKGKPTKLKPGCGPDTDVESRIARLWATDGRNAGTHLSIDSDCSIGCHADLLRDATYHASSLNEVSISFELYQEPDGGIYVDQVRCAVFLTEWLCARFGIQRQMPRPDCRGVIQRIARGGSNCVGVFGHRHQTRNRGPGDPGDHYFIALAQAGFMAFDFDSHEDIDFWKLIQIKHGLVEDGVPGPLTCDALRAAGYKDGLWRRPEFPAYAEAPT